MGRRSSDAYDNALGLRESENVSRRVKAALLYLSGETDGVA